MYQNEAFIMGIATVAVLIVVIISAILAARETCKGENVAINPKEMDVGDIPFDDIADKYLKLTNVEGSCPNESE